MFSVSKGAASVSNRIDTLIGAATNITGNITASGVIRVDGRYTGDIATESDVIVGEGGYIKGNIYAANVSISGNVEGNIKCSSTLEILSTGRLVGDVVVNNFSIGKGGVFNGSCTMTNNDVKKLNTPSVDESGSH